VAWLSLDPGDNDPVRFWRYVLLACQALQQSVTNLHSACSAPIFFGSSLLEPMLRTFLNELASLPHRGMLILEDYHLITEPNP